MLKYYFSNFFSNFWPFFILALLSESSILEKHAPENCMRKSLWPYAPWYIIMRWGAENNLSTLHLTLSPMLINGLL